jgi:hypothetical protein
LIRGKGRTPGHEQGYYDQCASVYFHKALALRRICYQPHKL